MTSAIDAVDGYYDVLINRGDTGVEIAVKDRITDDLGCRDSSEVLLVPAGERAAGVRSRPFRIRDVTIGLVRDRGRWLVDQPSSEEA